MVKHASRIVTGAHYGSKDWLVQRVSAVLMIAYLLLLGMVVTVISPHDYTTWKTVFNNQWMRIATFLFFVCLFWHAWIGVRNILMDYIHVTAMRLTLQILVILSLLFYLIWSAEILWG
ncbi:succinate dehydrogenase subunit D [Nitrosomonas cryotolerans]|uniref:Succinate dehydrogenase hydrophobic membrane anchor subunit n=1 Tax=Nitrosomonas cryotolerans ATCC 49181 TaxID=1131553 RepID=A0A1N6J6F0_9PROT|nr:succinate dehydrogenase, hydrophobic membrane anchor protein [Nitrosomonas cryotolerans]SFP45551.1 succinate dehydrogenase subunit D [Nitrosomonas cryotolerans]SIO39812.1 succinate dehydrogenase subunit D [Nitrosomonas cryotolerans ATCC 49181]